MASDDKAPTLEQDEKPAPPPGMYWVQMQGLWALRPIADLDMCQLSPIAGLHPAAMSAAEQRASWTDQQRLAQSAGAACSAAASSAGTPSAVEGGTLEEQLARTKGVIGVPPNHVQLAKVNGGTEGGEGSDTIARVRPRPLPQTPPSLSPLPPPQQPQQQQGGSEQQHQGWPNWFLQWAHRVKEGPDQGAPGPSTPPSAPPSPPGTPPFVWPRRLQRPFGRFHPLGLWEDAQLPRPWAQLALVAPVLAMVLSLVAMIRRMELSLSPGHPALLLHVAALGIALTHCVLLAAASKETVAAFLFVASTAMQAVQVCMYYTLSAADLAVTLEAHLESLPAAVC